jgi:hypothetical protein
MLRAQSDAAVGIIVSPECQAIGTALFVIDIGERAGFSKWH